MHQITTNTLWGTHLTASALMPLKRCQDTNGIFVGWTKDNRFIYVVVSGLKASKIYAPGFWNISLGESPQEKIAYYEGKKDSSEDYAEQQDYQLEIDRIKNEGKIL